MYQLFKPSFRVDEVLGEIKVCLDKGWTGIGYKTVEIENKWKECYGFPNAHFTTSNTAGLFLAFEVLRDFYEWPEEAEIISTPLTFVATNHSIINAGLTPIFAEVDATLNLSPQSVKACITNNTKAILFVGIGGNCANYREIKKIADEHNLLLVLDAAHMAGSFLSSEHIGLDADCVIFSFQAVKNLPTADSGMLCFKDDRLDDVSRKRSWLGIDKDTFSRTNSEGKYKWDYDVPIVSGKYHGNSVMAAMALVGLKYLNNDNAYRRLLAKVYANRLAKCQHLSFIEHTSEGSSTYSSQHLAQIILSPEINRNEFMVSLNKHGIYPGVHYKSNSFYKPYSHLSISVPFSEELSDRIVSLPLHLALSELDIEHICNCIIKILVT